MRELATRVTSVKKVRPTSERETWKGSGIFLLKGLKLNQ